MILDNIKEYIVGYNHWKTYSISEWHSSFIYPINFDWYIKFEKKFFHPLDSNGIPMRFFKNSGLQYLPSRIAGYSFGHWNNYIKTQNKKSLEIFIKCAEWFVSSAKKLDQAIVWEHNYDWKNIKKPWISAMAQGEAISVLTRAYYLTHDDKYLDFALQAYKPFNINIEHGGVRTYLNDKFIFFEEYPSSQPSHVLNGYMYSVIGLIDLSRMLQLNYDIIECCRETLENCCKYWDLGYWSSYDLHSINSVRNAATSMYHMLHVSLLKFLSQYSSSNILENQMKLWLDDHNKLTCRIRAAKEKIRYRLAFHAYNS